MIAAMAVFAIEDAFLKIASASLPVSQILIVFGFGGTAVFACVIRFKGDPLFTKDVASKPMQVRFIFELVGRLFYTLAIVLTPLSSVTVILQAAPLVLSQGPLCIWRKGGMAAVVSNFDRSPWRHHYCAAWNKSIFYAFGVGCLRYVRFCWA